MLDCSEALQKQSAHRTVKHHMKFPVPSPACLSVVLHCAGCDEDIDPGQEGGESSLPQQLHLHVDQEVFGLADLPLQVDGAGEAVELPGAEVAFLVAFDDAEDDLISRVGGRRADPEDLGRSDDVGLKAELVVGDADGRVVAVQGVAGTAAAFTASEEVNKERQNRNEQL